MILLSPYNIGLLFFYIRTAGTLECDPSTLSSFNVEAPEIVANYKILRMDTTLHNARLRSAAAEIYMPRVAVSFFPRGPRGSRPDAADLCFSVLSKVFHRCAIRRGHNSSNKLKNEILCIIDLCILKLSLFTYQFSQFKFE